MTLKLYGQFSNVRTQKILAVAKYLNLQIHLEETSHTQVKTKEFLAKNPLGKIPVLETPQGNLFESNTIIRHLARLGNSQTLYGENAFVQSQVDAWLDFSNNELDSEVFALALPLLGVLPFDGETNTFASNQLKEKLNILEKTLSAHKYIVGDNITLADFAIGSILIILFRTAYDEARRQEFPHLTKWVHSLIETESFAHAFGRARFVKTALKPGPAKEQPKKEKKQEEHQQGHKEEKKEVKKDQKEEKPHEKKEEKKQDKKEEKKQQKKEPKKAEKKEEKQPEKKPAKKEANSDEEEKPKKAEKNPLDSLPPSPFNLDDWKRRFVNSKDQAAEMVWFYENFDAAGWSLWRVVYDKAEGEGKMLIKTNNTMKGFLQRMNQDFRKYAFAMHGVYGDEPNFEIRGLWLWRGQEIAFDVQEHPSYEFHKFTKLDVTKENDRQLINDYWLNQEEDVSKVEGLTARTLAYFK